jgi:hypothetical protein
MTETRKIAEQIKAKNNCSLILINQQAMEFVIAGLCESRLEALRYMLAIA